MKTIKDRIHIQDSIATSVERPILVKFIPATLTDSWNWYTYNVSTRSIESSVRAHSLRKIKTLCKLPQE
jgi:hypothetical protein